MKTSTPNIKADYLSGADSLKPFYKYPLQQLDFGQVIQDKSGDDIDRALLKEVLLDQYQGFSPSAITKKHLDILDKPTTFSVTTGHQLVLFGGPLYTSYKVLSAVKLAEQISKEQEGYEVVPVFWIHTEDHDFEEINHYYTGFHAKHTYQGTFSGEVGAHVLEPDIANQVPKHFSEALRNAYQPGISMKMAYRRFVFELFDKYGVLIFDASDPRLKARFQRVLRQELSQSKSFTAINQTSTMLAAKGYPLQINPREINLFYSDEQGRDRIVGQNGHYEVLNRDIQIQPKEMEDLIANHPERFSPNVSLRPLYQEMVLPNLAYFGGWGEVAYWVQLKGVFETFQVNFPCVLPRMSATVFTDQQAKAWEALGFNLSDIQQPIHTLYKARTSEVWDSKSFDALQEEILAKIEAYKEEVASTISPTLARSAEALKVKSQKYLKAMKKKAERVIRHKHPASFREIDALKSKLQPDGWVQERIFSLAAFEGTISPEDFVEFAYQNCRPLEFDHQFWILP